MLLLLANQVARSSRNRCHFARLHFAHVRILWLPVPKSSQIAPLSLACGAYCSVYTAARRILQASRIRRSLKTLPSTSELKRREPAGELKASRWYDT